MEKINSFGLRIEWKAGVEMVVPDALSRGYFPVADRARRKRAYYSEAILNFLKLR